MEFSFLRGLFSSAYKLPLLLPTSRTKRKIKRKLSWPSFPFQLLAMSLSHLQHTIQKVAYSRIGLHFLSSFCLLNIHRADFLHQIARAPGLTHTPCLLTAPLRCLPTLASPQTPLLLSQATIHSISTPY